MVDEDVGDRDERDRAPGLHVGGFQRTRNFYEGGDAGGVIHCSVENGVAVDRRSHAEMIEVCGNDHEFILQARVGTLAHLRSVTDHDDGTASIVVVGGERFRILEFDTSHSYLSAAIQEDPLPEGPGEQDMTAALSRRLLDGLLTVRATDAGAIREHAPQEPLLLASFAATLLPLSGDQREQALDTLDLLDRLETLISFLPKNDRTLN